MPLPDYVQAEINKRSESSGSGLPDYVKAAMQGQQAEPQPQDQSINRFSEIDWSTPLSSPEREFISNKIKNIAAHSSEYAPIVGATVGGVVASPANIVAPGVAEAAGVGLGYMAGRQIEKAVKTFAGDRPSKTITGEVVETIKDIPSGVETGLSGPIIGKIAPIILKKAGDKIVKPILGRLSGLGKKSVTEAIKSGVEGEGIFKSSTAFDKSMRGEITGDDIVDNALGALNDVKAMRGAVYKDRLSKISKDQDIDATPIRTKLSDLMDQYNIKIDIDGNIDTSRIAMGKSGRKDISEIIDLIKEWGKKPGDNSPVGLDTLKRQLDDFYSDSSQARAFVTSLKNTVKDTIVKSVPEYADMTKGYADATKMIKDFESGLMLRKQGLTGRIVADQTLRRLTSSMKDNFELRGALVDTLGSTAAKDLSGQIAGYGMRSTLPVGIQGSGAAIVGEAFLMKYVDPKYWPVIMASSPRVQGEFLRMFGKAIKTVKPMSKQISSAVATQVPNITNEIHSDIDAKED